MICRTVWGHRIVRVAVRVRRATGRRPVLVKLYMNLALSVVQEVLLKEQRVVLEMDYLVMHRVLDPVQVRLQGCQPCAA